MFEVTLTPPQILESFWKCEVKEHLPASIYKKLNKQNYIFEKKQEGYLVLITQSQFSYTKASENHSIFKTKLKFHYCSWVRFFTQRTKHLFLLFVEAKPTKFFLPFREKFPFGSLPWCFWETCYFWRRRGRGRGRHFAHVEGRQFTGHFIAQSYEVRGRRRTADRKDLHKKNRG